MTRIVVMAKAPVAGLVKTRLIPVLGADGAAALARRLLAHAAQQAAAAGVGPVELCVAPDADHEAVRALGHALGVGLHGQGEGDLGQRMHRVFARHGGPLLLMGSDAPAIDAAMLRRAAAALETHDAVFVPAHDGGYALVGLRAPCASLFDGVPWSTPAVMAGTRARLAAAGLRHVELPPVHDIDDAKDLVHVPPDPAPGRSCPWHYRYAPASFARDAAFDCEVLYVVGGLYGNEPALDSVLRLFERETGRKRIVFNGDFHWFDIDPDVFRRVNDRVLAFDALRGNVETELADASPGDDAGCGCAYPDWVDDAVVERSNRILRSLRQTARADAASLARLAALPMHLRVDVGPLRVAVVHGDAQSLAGWGFAQERLRDRTHQAVVRGWFDQGRVDAFACSHTCLPLFLELPAAGRLRAPAVLNNGAAGMPNFRGDAAGLLTRIALRAFAGPQRRYGLERAGVFMDAIAVDLDAPRWHAQFLRQWPPGSAGHASYWPRLRDGPAYTLREALSAI